MQARALLLATGHDFEACGRGRRRCRISLETFSRKDFDAGLPQCEARTAAPATTTTMTLTTTETRTTGNETEHSHKMDNSEASADEEPSDLEVEVLEAPGVGLDGPDDYMGPGPMGLDGSSGAEGLVGSRRSAASPTGAASITERTPMLIEHAFWSPGLGEARW